DSGRWPSKGVFASISQRSKEPQKQYTLAAEMEDIHMGDTHLISLNDCGVDDDEPSCDQYVVLIVAQHRNKFDFTALDLAKTAKQLKATVHLPRIGVGSQGFNWYGTEKLIKKYLSSRGIPTYIYYFKRESATTNNKRTNEQSYGNNKRLSIEKGTINKNRLKLHLPCYLSGVHIFFHDIDENTKKRLQRFVYAFDGDVNETADPDTITHILAAGNCQDILALRDACPNACVINIEWLDACISQGTRLNTDIYEL
ncbi:unnamed protein product, partial [Rotaria sp. Silwood2]